eukprot:gnl/MRDRNA2_/MRDRNA2_79417_c0_seq2.p1 gnl/MRDRNA2_/MRDRNA2_79417_c0~~gnl/MRDRNA2_/MRDRNA2_79417_c0_seq2.p1  ORF type:complete len:445 (+),score=90.75 gnl/MRDRNA2_/MRDRNA2_79417_c0_seq2:102-1436(+)
MVYLWLVAALLHVATAVRKQSHHTTSTLVTHEFTRSFLGKNPADDAAKLQSHALNNVSASTYKNSGMNLGADQVSDDGKETHVICRISAAPGLSSAGEVSVVVDLNTNSRALMFGTGLADTSGESPSACVNSLSKDERKGCLAAEGKVFASASECPTCPCYVGVRPFPMQFAYATEMAKAVERRCSSPWEWPSSTMNVLMIGLGGGAIPSQLLKKCQKDFHIECIDLDGRVIDVATKYFGLESSDSLTVQQGDGLQAVRTRVSDGRHYDAVLIDCFAQGGVTPLPCRSEQLLTQLKLVLKPKGFVAQHLWNDDWEHEEVAQDFRDAVMLYRKTFGATKVVSLSTRVNDVVYASAESADIPYQDVPSEHQMVPASAQTDDITSEDAPPDQMAPASAQSDDIPSEDAPSDQLAPERAESADIPSEDAPFNQVSMLEPSGLNLAGTG